MNTILTIIGIVLILLAIVLAIVTAVNRRENGSTKKSGSLVLALFGILFIAAGASFTIVPSGYVGVRSTFGQISERTVPTGINWKLPFAQQITLVNSKQQDVVIPNQVWGESSEKTPVYAAEITVTYQISADKAAWICMNVTGGTDNLVTPVLVSSAIKSAMVELDTNTVTVRSRVEPLALDKLTASINEKYGEDVVNVIKVTVNQMDFEASYNEAISNKSIARQNQERQEIENNTAIAKAKAEKEVAIAQAEAQAESAKIAAQAEADVAKIAAQADAEVIRMKAEAQAAANKQLAASLTPEVLKSQFYASWDGKLPQVMGEGTVITSVGD